MPEDARIFTIALGLAIVLLGLVLFVRAHPAASPTASPPPAAGLATAGLPPPDAEEALIGRVATVVASRPVRAGCRLTSCLGGNLTELGEARTVPGSATSGIVLLAPSICSNLLGFSHGLAASDRACVAQNGPGLCSGAVDADLLALHTLAHETWHVRGIRDEATTDCYALQSVATVAQTLGADAVDAHALATYYAAHSTRSGDRRRLTAARTAGTAARSTCTRAPAGGRANPATIARFCFDCVDEQPRGRASGAASASCVS